MPKISVIIPVYNVEKYLPACLDSVVNQTLRDIEIICINDGSPDNSLSILQDYASKDERIVLIDKQNEGVGKARNDGIRAAGGEFIAFMDSDDYYPAPDVLEKLYTAAKKNNVKIAGGYRVKFTENGTITEERYPISDGGLAFSANGVTDYNDYQFDYGFTLYIFEREMLIANNIVFPPYKRFQDPPFFVRAMIAAGRFYACDFPCYRYRLLPMASKYNIRSTLDYLHGLTDNLNVSRDNNLAKLHYLTAQRLNKEGSFMAIQNLFDERASELLALFIKATAAVDTEWLKNEGYPLPEPFVPEVFTYAVSTAEKYEKIRNNKAVKAASKLLKR